MVIQDRQLDFEDFSSDTEKLSAILKRCELSCQKHKLAYEYYRARKFALLHPSVFACLAIGVLGFVVTTSVIKRHMKIGNVQVQDLMTLAIGFLGFFVGTNILLMNQWNFGSRESMHLSAVLELEGLGDRVRFWRMDQRVGTGGYGDGQDEDESKLHNGSRKFDSGERKALGVVAEPDTHKMRLVVARGKKMNKMESDIQEETSKAKKMEDQRTDVSRFSGFNGAYQQINRSCKSKIPNTLNRPFDLFESRLESMSLGHLGIVWDTRMRRNQVMRLAAVEIYNEITGYWQWPFGTPDIDDVIDRSMKRVARLISKTYREPLKVKCCGFTIFRCCCRHRHTKAHVLHNIFDGMEARERDMMHSRGIPELRYTKGAKGVSNFQGDEGRGSDSHGGGRSYTSTSEMHTMEDDAYEADQKLQYLEDGYEDEDYTIEDADYTIDEDPSHQFTAYNPGADYDPGANSYTRGISADDDRSYHDSSRGGPYLQIAAHSKSGNSYRELAGDDHKSLKSNRSRKRVVSPTKSSVGQSSSRRGGAGAALGVSSSRRGGASAALVVDNHSQSELGWDEASASQYG